MEWDLDDSRSIWPQLKELLIRAIVSGEYEKGGTFPTVRQLAQEAGVNRNTMQRAMAELEAEGLLITNRTAGRTVTTDQALIDAMKERLAEANIQTYLNEMQSLGYTDRQAVELMNDKFERGEMK